MFNNTIENISYHKTRRVDVTVGTTYGSDIDRAREVLTGVARSVPGGLADPQPELVVGPANLTITIGFGPELFRKLQLEHQLPNGFSDLPSFKID